MQGQPMEGGDERSAKHGRPCPGCGAEQSGPADTRLDWVGWRLGMRSEGFHRRWDELPEMSCQKRRTHSLRNGERSKGERTRENERENEGERYMQTTQSAHGLFATWRRRRAAAATRRPAPAASGPPPLHPLPNVCQQQSQQHTRQMSAAVSFCACVSMK